MFRKPGLATTSLRSAAHGRGASVAAPVPRSGGKIPTLVASPRIASAVPATRAGQNIVIKPRKKGEPMKIIASPSYTRPKEKPSELINALISPRPILQKEPAHSIPMPTDKHTILEAKPTDVSSKIYTLASGDKYKLARFGDEFVLEKVYSVILFGADTFQVFNSDGKPAVLCSCKCFIPQGYTLGINAYCTDGSGSDVVVHSSRNSNSGDKVMINIEKKITLPHVSSKNIVRYIFKCYDSVTQVPLYTQSITKQYDI